MFANFPTVNQTNMIHEHKGLIGEEKTNVTCVGIKAYKKRPIVELCDTERKKPSNMPSFEKWIR